MRTALAVSLVALGALAPGASASHNKGEALPDDSAIDEYLPGVPGPGGERTPGGGGDGQGSTLPSGAAKQLQQLGSAGAATAALAEATDTTPGTSKAGRKGTLAGESGGKVSGTPGSVLEKVLSAATGGAGGGMGAALPIILAAAALAALALLIHRLRTPSAR